MYLLDTDILVSIKRGKKGIQERLYKVGFSQCAISEVSLAELYVGVYKSNGSVLEPVLAFLEESLSTVSISSSVKTYARIRAELETKGTRLEDMDLFIAATALEKGYTLVTHNTRHYSRIPGLKVEDWIEE